MTNNKEKKEIRNGTVLSYLYLLIYNIAQIIYTPILLKSLGTNMYGVYTLCISIVNYFTLLDFGLGNAVVRFSSLYRNRSKDERNSIYGSFFAIYFVLAIIALSIGVFISLNCNWFFSTEFTANDISMARTIILILSVNIAITLPLSVFSSIVTSYQKFIFLKILNILKTIVSTIIMILFLLLGYKAISLALITLIVNIVYLLCIMLYAIKVLDIRLSFNLKNKGVIKDIFSFSIFALLLLVIDKINLNCDMMILGKYSTPTELTMYSISSRIFQIFLSLGGVISSMLLPKYTLLVEEKKYRELEEDFIEKSKWQYTIVIYISFGFLIFGRSFLNIWLGSDYTYSYIITILLMFSAAIPLALNVANVILQAKNNQKFRTFILLLILILNVIISIILVKPYGAFGCAIGTAFTYIVGHVIIMAIYFKKNQKINMRQFWLNVFSTTFIHLISFSITYIIEMLISYSIINNFLCLILYLIISSLLEYYFLLNTKEKSVIINTMNRIWRKKHETS